MATNNATNVSNPMTVAQGGTGDATFTAYAVICGGTTTTAPLQSVASVGSSGDALTSNGAGALPSFQPLSSGTPLSIGSISTNWYPSGSIYGGMANNSNFTSTLTGTLYFNPIYISKTTTFTNIATGIQSGNVGTTVLGLYNDSGNGKPTGSPIANSNSGSLSNATGTVVNFTFGSPITLTPGVYWCALSTSATCIYYGPTNSSQYQIGARGLGISTTPTSANAFIIPQAGWSQTFVYNATLPSVGTLAAVACFSSGDITIFLKAQ